VQWEVQYNFALVTQLANTITSATVMMNASFPNVTVRDFETIGGFLDGMGGIMSANMAPLIKSEEIEQWEEYSVQNQWWIQVSKHLKEIEEFHQDSLHGTIQDHEHDRRVLQEEEKISPTLFGWENGSRVAVSGSPGEVHAPLWQLSPPDVATVNTDILQDSFVATLFEEVKAMNRSVLSRATPITDLFGYLFDPEEEYLKPNPFAFILQPVFDTYEDNKTMVALLIAVTSYENLLDKLLPDGSRGILCVIRDGCGTDISYVLNGREATFLGYGDFHDPAYDAYKANTTMELYANVTEGLCIHTLEIYPTVTIQDSYKTNKPAVYTSIVVMAFVLTSILLIVYDRMVTRRQEKTMVSAIRSGKLVASLFPSTVVDRVMEDAHAGEGNKKPSMMSETSKQATSIDSGENQVGFFKTRPIADFFPQCTIIFADIAGFTSWASTRQPHQVFTLLETLYGSLDRIAKSRKIFKVETVGDCYVAVAGLPTPCKDHAVVVCRFARDCHATIREVTRNLEVSLGPDTADLTFRIGVHSGCVTGGTSVAFGQQCSSLLFAFLH
jgi:Adenylate and Guanylate cyclase catalytic domain